MYTSEDSMLLFDFIEWVGSCQVSGCFLCTIFQGLPLGAPCICHVYFGVPFSITNLYVPIFTYKTNLFDSSLLKFLTPV